MSGYFSKRITSICLWNSYVVDYKKYRIQATGINKEIFEPLNRKRDSSRKSFIQFEKKFNVNRLLLTYE